MSAEERQRLLGEIAAHESQVTQMRAEVHTKTTEMQRLKQEVDNAGGSHSKYANNGNGHLPQEFNGPDDLTNAHVG